MNTKLILIIAFSYLYMFFEMWMNMSHKRKKTIEKSNDKGSLLVLIVAITIGCALSFSIGATRMGRIYHWNTFFAVGAILSIIGLYIRISSILTLREQFTYTVTKITNHVLVQNGWYKYIRHPGYLGQLIIFLGIATALSNWLSIVAMMVPVTAGFLYRISIEEKFMQEQMGQPYLDYQRLTRRLIPKIY